MQRDVEYIVKGSSPLYSVISVLTSVFFLTAVVFIYLELRDFYKYPWGIFFGNP